MARHPNPPRDRIVFGGILILLGFVLLFGNGLALSRVWPYVVLIAGLAHLVAPDPGDDGRPSYVGAAWLLFVAGWGFVNVYHLFGFSYASSWPLLLTGGGGFIVWKALQDSARRRTGSERAS